MSSNTDCTNNCFAHVLLDRAVLADMGMLLAATGILAVMGIPSPGGSILCRFGRNFLIYDERGDQLKPASFSNCQSITLPSTSQPTIGTAHSWTIAFPVTSRWKTLR